MALTPRKSKINGKANNPLCVMYVEVNDTNFINAGCYQLQNGEQLFDIAIIFAANINYNVAQQRAYLHFNENVTRVLSDLDRYVRPIQDKGSKVLLSILGNHEGAGFCNFQDEESARDFAMQLANAVETYGLDGIDFDDEYADYGNNGTGQPNAYSFLFLLRELRALIPDKIISFYYFGPAAQRLTYQNLVAGDFLDYSWNAIYSTYTPPNVPNLNRAQLGPAAINVQSTSTATCRNFAQRTIADGYGVYLCYGLPNGSHLNYLTHIADSLYGVQLREQLGCLQGGPPAKENDQEKKVDKREK